MRLTNEDYIKENIKLSLKNTDIILKSIDKNVNTIKDLTIKIRASKDKQESLIDLMRIKEISIESVIEKCNMLKASLDRYTIPYEDVQIPKVVKYIKLRNLPHSPPIDPNNNERFRKKISKDNMPPLLAQIPMDDDGGGDDYD